MADQAQIENIKKERIEYMKKHFNSLNEMDSQDVANVYNLFMYGINKNSSK